MMIIFVTDMTLRSWNFSEQNPSFSSFKKVHFLENSLAREPLSGEEADVKDIDAKNLLLETKQT